MSVIAGNHTFVIPPQRAIWIPSACVHEISYRGSVSLRTLYIDEKSTGLANRECEVIEISPFVGSLIVEAAKFCGGHLPSQRETRIIDLLLDEISTMRRAPIHSPMPTDARLLKVCREIIARPAEQLTLDELADIAGMGRRTFTRLFKKETGMGAALWRQQVRLMEALSLLSEGHPVTMVAFDVGYDSPSAFTALFHRSFGKPPSHYRPRQ